MGSAQDTHHDVLASNLAARQMAVDILDYNYSRVDDDPEVDCAQRDEGWPACRRCALCSLRPGSRAATLLAAFKASRRHHWDSDTGRRNGAPRLRQGSAWSA